MLKAVSLPFYCNGHWWSISSLTGALIRSDQNPILLQSEVPAIVRRALEFCDDPYMCDWAQYSTNLAKYSDAEYKYLKKMNSRLHWIGNKRFLLSCLYASISQPIFNTTNDAISAISDLPEQIRARADHCLQRSLLAAKTSLSFQKFGVLFIGASISSAEMHAWIIEEGCQPDFEDRNWINFRPLLALISR